MGAAKGLHRHITPMCDLQGGGMMETRQFKASDLDSLPTDYLGVDGSGLETGGPAFTAIEDGQVIACAGLVEQWRGRAVAWLITGPQTGRHLVAITKAAVRFFNSHPEYRRIEGYVVEGNHVSAQWHVLMGFKIEGFMEAFTPEGRGAFMFGWIRGQNKWRRPQYYLPLLEARLSGLLELLARGRPKVTLPTTQHRLHVITH